MRIFLTTAIAFTAAAASAAAAAEPPRPKTSLQSLFSDTDYPAAARAARQQGIVRFMLGVGVNGRLANCTITRSSGSAALDATTCRLLRSRARFTPARDASGKAVSGSLAGQIRWTLPASPPPVA